VIPGGKIGTAPESLDVRFLVREWPSIRSKQQLRQAPSLTGHSRNSDQKTEPVNGAILYLAKNHGGNVQEKEIIAIIAQTVL
jgi:hypothetical protein